MADSPLKQGVESDSDEKAVDQAESTKDAAGETSTDGKDDSGATVGDGSASSSGDSNVNVGDDPGHTDTDNDPGSDPIDDSSVDTDTHVDSDYDDPHGDTGDTHVDDSYVDASVDTGPDDDGHGERETETQEPIQVVAAVQGDFGTGAPERAVPSFVGQNDEEGQREAEAPVIDLEPDPDTFPTIGHTPIGRSTDFEFDVDDGGAEPGPVDDVFID